MKEQFDEWEKKGILFEGIVGIVVKWIILLFGFVVFFNMLQLMVVVGFLVNIFQKFIELILVFLQVFVYFGIYWVVGLFLCFVIIKGFGVVGFDDCVGCWIKFCEVKGEMIGVSGQFGCFVFYVVLFFGLLFFFQVFGQEVVVQLLCDMMIKFFEFFLNVVVVLILVFIGCIVVMIVCEVVINFFVVVGVDSLVQCFGLGNIEGSCKFFDIVGLVVFFFIFILIFVVVVDSLKIEVILVFVCNMFEQLLIVILLIFVVIFVMGIGWFIVKMVCGLVEGFFKGVGFDELLKCFGFEFLVF